MSQTNDLSRSLVSFEQNAILITVVELSQSSWLIAGTVPGIERQPLKKITPDETTLLRLLHRWRDEALAKGCTTTRIAVAFEAGRDGFWLARAVAGQTGDEVHVIHSSSRTSRSSPTTRSRASRRPAAPRLTCRRSRGFIQAGRVTMNISALAR